MNILGHDFFLKKSPLVIAEIGSGHGGSLDVAIDLVIDAARAGAGAVKIQTYTPDSMTIECDEPDFEIKAGPWRGRRLYDLYAEAMTPRDWHQPLFEAAAANQIPIFSTPFGVDDVDFLESLGCPAYKIASPEIAHFELLEAVRETKKPVFISTGMATTFDVRRALEALYGRDVVIMHCVSGYPTPTGEANLWNIRNLQSHFARHQIGFSDHTVGSVAAIAAVSLGATVIEKHIGVRGSEDADFAYRPERFSDFVRGVESAWSARQVSYRTSEDSNLQMKRSVYVVEDIKKGDKLTYDNTRVIRPGYGLDPSEYGGVIGRAAKHNIKRGTALFPGMIE
jgi:pseudaminic acid synthase